MTTPTEVFYLRLSETPEASLAPEVRVHRLLLDRGVKVPEVIYFEPFDEGLQRSVMITTEIPGISLAESGRFEAAPLVARDAGRDLAIVNGVPVEGFGWIRRDQVIDAPLRAEHPTVAGWQREYLDAVAQLDRAGVLDTHDVRAAHRHVEALFGFFPREHPWLAHGDLDATHVYHKGDRYTGMIDFGEVRGANQLYDLGHFLLHDGESFPVRLFPHLLSGYREVASVSLEDEREIQLVAAAIGIRALARSLRHSPGCYQHWLRIRVRELLFAT